MGQALGELQLEPGFRYLNIGTSSMIKCMAYSDEHEVLHVQFANGSVYEYQGVELAHVVRWEDRSHELTWSLGKDFDAEITKKPTVYPYQRLK